MHNDATTICEAWPRITDDMAAIGFPHGVMQPSSGGNSESSAVENAALSTSADAVAWIAELHDVTTRLVTAAWPHQRTAVIWNPGSLQQLLTAAIDAICADWKLDDIVDFDPQSATYRGDVFGLARLADKARRHWPATLAGGTTTKGVTVGQRGSSIEVCAGCLQAIGGGRADPLKRIDGDPFHVKNPQGVWCYHQALRSRGKLGGQAAC
jgi:hypothetical protein